MLQADASSSIGGGRTVKLKDLVPAATNTVNTTFVVLDKAAPHAQARDGAETTTTTCLALVADETAAAHFLPWGGECGAEKVGEFAMRFVETPNVSELGLGRDPDDPRRMVAEAVISPYSQIFKPLR